VLVAWSVDDSGGEKNAKSHHRLSGNTDLGNQELHEQACWLPCKPFLGYTGCMHVNPMHENLHSRVGMSGRALKAKRMR
jgi:hypothetical protein